MCGTSVPGCRSLQSLAQGWELLPFQGEECSALLYLLAGTMRDVPNGSTSAASALREICVIRVRQKKQRDRYMRYTRYVEQNLFLHTRSPLTAVLPLTQGKSAECPEWQAQAQQVHSVESA